MNVVFGLERYRGFQRRDYGRVGAYSVGVKHPEIEQIGQRRHATYSSKDAGHMGAMAEVVSKRTSHETLAIDDARVQIGVWIDATVDNRDSHARPSPTRTPGDGCVGGLRIEIGAHG